VNLDTLPVYSEGRVEVQDLASQTVAMICAPSPGQRWWDVCAGGGGKSLHLAQLMKGKGVVTATDIQDRKLDELRRRARRGGFQNIQVKSWDGKPMRQKQATYDGVLVDAPCTCSGTWRRNPAMRWTARPGEKDEMAVIQRRILNTAVSGLKEGGVLVYATCSFFKRENEEVVEEFLAAHADFALEPYAHPLTGTPTPGTLQIWPWDGDCDAMFTARMRRRGNGGSS
jgi:16S rRNA (cytosine967-C5)-methyltransferase